MKEYDCTDNPDGHCYYYPRYSCARCGPLMCESEEAYTEPPPVVPISKIYDSPIWNTLSNEQKWKWYDEERRKRLRYREKGIKDPDGNDYEPLPIFPPMMGRFYGMEKEWGEYPLAYRLAVKYFGVFIGLFLLG